MQKLELNCARIAVKMMTLTEQRPAMAKCRKDSEEKNYVIHSTRYQLARTSSI